MKQIGAWSSPGGSSIPRTGGLMIGIVGALLSGCSLTAELKYDEKLARMKEPRHPGLVLGEPIFKQGSTSLLLGPGRDELDPADFELDSRKVEAAFGPAGPGEYQFILLSDIQIRDRCADLGFRTSRFLDKNPFMPIEVTLLNFYQDHADVFYAGYVLKAIRMGLARNPDIDFVAHLGDSMQLGIRSELDAFSELIGKFLLRGEKTVPPETWREGWLTPTIELPGGRGKPFFNLLGNHDVMIMGNFNEEGPVNPAGPAPENPCISSLAKLKEALADSRWVGQEALGGCPPLNVMGGGTRERGYYSVDRRLPNGRQLRLIMLHSNEDNLLDPVIPGLQKGALYPAISPAQYDWLVRLLEESEADDSPVDAVLLFAHNGLAEIGVRRSNNRAERDASQGELVDLLGRYRKVLGFFSGHLHSGCRPVLWTSHGRRFYEYLQPAIQEYPKCWAKVTLGGGEGGAPYRLQVQYYNLEDILEVTESAGLDVDDADPKPYPDRFHDWLVALDRKASRVPARVKLLAEYCYRGSRFDIRHDLREDVTLAFNPAIKERLLRTYRGADRFWAALKDDRSEWNDHRRLLEADETGGQQ